MAINNQQKVGILLVNVGTPQEPTEDSIRSYLREFLSDPAVVKLPRWIWFFILNFIILKRRPQKLVSLYKKIWIPEGSPLYAISLKQQQALAAQFSSSGITVKLAMRYGEPAIKKALQEFADQGVTKIVLCPLFPHYADATVGSVKGSVLSCVRESNFTNIELKTIEPYFAKTNYIAALKNSIKNYWSQNRQGEILLFSYHSLPQSSPDSANYYQQCHRTTTLVAESLDLKSDEYQTCFQSRFGFGKWLGPQTDSVLVELGARGVKNIDIICPGFAADCLETLEEIAVRYADKFTIAGGEKLNYIPSLNENSDFIELLRDIILEQL